MKALVTPQRALVSQLSSHEGFLLSAVTLVTITQEIWSDHPSNHSSEHVYTYIHTHVHMLIDLRTQFFKMSR